MAVATLLLSLLLGGCGNTVRTAGPVDPDEARTALQVALDAWQAGKVPSDLRAQSPEIVAQDADWQAGMQLAGYTLTGAGDARDANLECPVRLMLRNQQGEVFEKTVTYVVGTDPVLTVFRKVSL